MIKLYYKRIKELRVDRDKNQSEIAKMLNMSQANYSYLENGTANLKAEEIKKLCLYYGVSADYLLELPENLKYPK